MPVPVVWRLAFAVLLLGSVTLGARGNEEAAGQAGPWTSLLPDEGMGAWKRIAFDDGGKVTAADGVLVLEEGNPFTGVVWSNPVVRCDYEIELEARRDRGGDFFCGLTVPVGETHCTLIVGGWGGGVVGISNIDGLNASENETTQYREFESNRWYRVRLRVTEERLAMWVDDKQMFSTETEERTISLYHGEIRRCTPLGLATWQTGASIRRIRVRTLRP